MKIPASIRGFIKRKEEGFDEEAELKKYRSKIPNLEGYDPVSGKFDSDLVKANPQKSFKSSRHFINKKEEGDVMPPIDDTIEEQKKKIKDKIKKFKKIKRSSYNPEKDDYDYEY